MSIRILKLLIGNPSPLPEEASGSAPDTESDEQISTNTNKVTYYECVFNLYAYLNDIIS